MQSEHVLGWEERGVLCACLGGTSHLALGTSGPASMFLAWEPQMLNSGKAVFLQFEVHESSPTVHITDGETEAQRREGFA